MSLVAGSIVDPTEKMPTGTTSAVVGNKCKSSHSIDAILGLRAAAAAAVVASQNLPQRSTQPFNSHSGKTNFYNKDYSFSFCFA